VVSRSGIPELKAHYPVRDDKVMCIYNGIDMEKFATDREARRSTLRKSMGLGEDRIVITSIGSLIPQKNYGMVLEAAEKVVRSVPDARFLIVGDGPLKKELVGKAHRMGLREHVIFTGRREDIPSVLSATDIYVNSSLFEGLPFTILEAMAAELPVIATTVNGNSEAVKDNETGLLIPAGDTDALSDGILFLIRTPRARKKFGDKGREYVRDSYTISKMVMNTADLYEMLLTEETAGKTNIRWA
jgi:glycosyltransferase involved in cell wall biosynthesis